MNTTPLISAKNITLFKNDKLLLDDVSLEIHKNEILTIIGANGAGKTSLIKILLGLITSNTGTVDKSPNARFSYLPQKLHTESDLPITVQYFLKLGGTSNDEIEKSLEIVAGTHLLKTNICNLSGGELKRVLLARALSRKPDLIFLDEPSAGLDINGQMDLYRLIGEIKNKTQCGFIIISHDLHLVMLNTDKVICLNHHICCAGVPSEITHHPDYLALFGDAVSKDIGIYTHSHDHHHHLDGSSHHNKNCHH